MHEGEALDLELHRRLSLGERQAFDQLFRRYGPSAFGAALRIVRQQALAEEVVQEAFLALWRAPEAYDPARGPFRSFFLALVHHRAVDTVRREERLRARAERAQNLEPGRGEDVAEVVVDDVAMDDRRKEVRGALETLPAEQRRVIELAYFGGYTQTRIAEELGIPVGTVKTRTFAAMRKLRRALYQED